MFESLRNQPVLITGATGFVGGHLTRRLLDLGAKTTVLVRSSSNPELVSELSKRGATVVEGNLTDQTAVDRAIKNNKFVFHVAALYREAKHPDQAYFDVNLEGTRHILDACLKYGVDHLVHTSTTGVHSHIENPPADESYPYHPADVYQVSKTEAEKLVLNYFQSKGLSGTILRPAMIWGEGDTRILKLFRGISQRKMPLIGSGQSWTHWIYVQDLVDAYLLSVTKPEAKGETFLIAGRRPVKMDEVFDTIARISGTKLLPFKIPALPIQLVGTVVEVVCRPFGIEPPLHRRRADFFVKNRCFDTSKAQKLLGFTPRYDFEEEAKIIFDWYKQNGWL